MWILEKQAWPCIPLCPVKEIATTPPHTTQMLKSLGDNSMLASDYLVSVILKANSCQTWWSGPKSRISHNKDFSDFGRNVRTGWLLNSTIHWVSGETMWGVAEVFPCFWTRYFLYYIHTSKRNSKISRRLLWIRNLFATPEWMMDWKQFFHELEILAHWSEFRGVQVSTLKRNLGNGAGT